MHVDQTKGKSRIPDSGDTQVQCNYLLEGGSLALRRCLGPHLQLLAQRHQLLHLCHHQRLFLINQLGRREREREREGHKRSEDEASFRAAETLRDADRWTRRDL